MSKYIIDIPKTVGVLEAVGSVRYTFFDGIQVQTIVLKGDEIEELNSDYINEHFGDLQDDAYQKGFEEGKAVNDKGCEGCMYRDNTIEHHPCGVCCNAYKSQWKAKQTDNKIKVKDEVVWTEDENVAIVVTRVYTANNMEWCDGVCKDGKVYHILTENARKTGRCFDIDKILEEMKE